MKWASEYLPSDASFVGGHPLLKEVPLSIEDADPAIFAGAKYTVTPGSSSDEQSIRTVVGLIEALGARPVFLDPAEHDSYAAAMHHLPVVMSSAFVNSTAGSEGWREMHMLAESQFETFGRHATNDPLDNEAVCLADPESLVHWIDALILELYAFRNEIKDSREELIERFVTAWELRAKWEADAVVPQDGVRIPSAGESIASAMLGEKLAERLGALRRKEEESENKYRSRRSGS
jgi:prephenate dehydrogenase